MSKRSLPQVIHPISITRTSTHAHALLPNSHTPTSELSRPIPIKLAGGEANGKAAKEERKGGNGKKIGRRRERQRKG
ncbi:hypothetical protein E2C01_089425 [Portunus trituberculatus]|uniref:Uncharacterized protein n=1 Tax=Portunus trituberculatus TaxID=210409 RepID=A0A5B7JIR9_PORTR|nr:hypothetical protein [Portunus trituberculatus]